MTDPRATVSAWPLPMRCHRALRFFDVNGPAKRIAHVVIDYSLALDPPQLEMRAEGLGIFLAETNLSKGRISLGLSDLQRLRIVSVHGAAGGQRRYMFDEDWRKWKCAPLKKEWGDEIKLALLIEGRERWQRYTTSLTAHGDAGMLFPDEATLDLAIIDLRRQSETVPGPGTGASASGPLSKPARGIEAVPGPGTGEPVPVAGKESYRTLVTGTGTGMSYRPAAAGVPGPGTTAQLLAHARLCLGESFIDRQIGHGGLIVCLGRENAHAVHEAISELKLRRENQHVDPLKNEIQWFKNKYREIRDEQ